VVLGICSLEANGKEDGIDQSLPQDLAKGALGFDGKKKEKNSAYLNYSFKKTSLFSVLFKAENERNKIAKKSMGKNQFPWHAVITSDGNVCGGSLLDNSWVLTTASCVKK
jgi:Trypsin